MTQTMQAAHITRHGGPEVVQVGPLPLPRPRPGEVLVRLAAAAANHLDLWVRMGIPGLKPALPHVLGSDGAGTVEELGEGVEGLAVGSPVLVNPGVSCRRCAYCRAGEHSLCESFHLLGEHLPGTFAEYVAVPRESVYPVPPGLSMVQAAALPLVFVTAWRMLFTRARLLPGEDVLVLGIGGGVAGAALVLARGAGARVFVTSSDEAKLERARALGAAGTIHHPREEYWKRIRELTGGKGADVVVDSIGGELWANTLASVKKGGRVVTCGATAGPRPSTHLQRIFWNQITVLGSTMGSDRDFAQMLDAVRAGGIEPVIDSTYPLAQAATALARLEAGKQFGKIVLTIGRER